MDRAARTLRRARVQLATKGLNAGSRGPSGRTIVAHVVTQGIGLRPHPWAGVSRPGGPAGRPASPSAAEARLRCCGRSGRTARDPPERSLHPSKGTSQCRRLSQSCPCRSTATSPTSTTGGRSVRLISHLGGRRIPHRRVGPHDVQGVRAERRAPSRSLVRRRHPREGSGTGQLADGGRGRWRCIGFRTQSERWV